MDRTRFFAALRTSTSGVFGTSLSQSQVAGTGVILDAGQLVGLPLKHLAYALGTGYHETGGRMQPVNENLNYSSAQRLCEVWPSRFPTKASAAPYVRNPQKLANRVYANRMGNGPEASGDGWRYRGRALPQLTGKENYAKASKLVGVDLIADPDAANDTDISAHILVEGMRSGMFTDKKLADFISGDRADYVGARAIINSDVKANGAKIAGYARAFETALRDAGYIGQAPKTLPTPQQPVEAVVVTPAAPTPQPTLEPTPTVKNSGWKALAALIAYLLPQRTSK